jgi:N-formylglutamate deformylase
MDLYRLIPGTTRLLVSIPHSGTFLPSAFDSQLTDDARPLPDTDWYVDRLYDFLKDLGATVLIATHSRYVVDLNRPPDDAPLYPGMAGSGIVPVETFAGHPIWRPGNAPDAADVRTRIARYWQPYHDRLRAELHALRSRHGSAVLWDAHSIKSQVPRLFTGDLPVLNFGTNDGRSCDQDLAARLLGHAQGIPHFTAVLDGRFKGGYITRAYGDPADGINAVQLELAQRSYMDETTGAWLPDRAQQIAAVLRALVEIATR